MIGKFTVNDYSLRPTTAADRDAVIRLRNIDAIAQGMGENLAVFTSTTFDQELSVADVYTIEISGKAAGGVILNEMLDDSGDVDRTCREISYYLAPDYWSQGIMVNLLTEFISRLHKMGINHLQAEVFIDNQRSMALLQRLSFNKDAELLDPLALKVKAIWSLVKKQ